MAHLVASTGRANMRSPLFGLGFLVMAGLTACGSSLGGPGTGTGGKGGQSSTGSAGAVGGGTVVGAGGSAGVVGSGGVVGTGGAGGTNYGPPVVCVPGVPRPPRSGACSTASTTPWCATSSVSPRSARPPSRRPTRCTQIPTARCSPTRGASTRTSARHREGGHGRRDPEGEVHRLRPGDIGLLDGDHQELRPQGVPPPADRRRGRALPGDW